VPLSNTVPVSPTGTNSYAYAGNINVPGNTQAGFQYMIKPRVYYQHTNTYISGLFTNWAIEKSCAPITTGCDITNVAPAPLLAPSCRYDYAELTAASPEKIIGIRFHLMSHGAINVFPEVTQQDIDYAINYLNNRFQGSKIRFTTFGLIERHNFIEDLNGTVPVQYSLLQIQRASSIYNRSKLLNIYITKSHILNEFSGNEAGGIATFPWAHLLSGDFTVMEEAAVKSGFISAIAHEVGHYFGLYHTFGVPNQFVETFFPSYSRFEKLNGDECATRGDQVPDTYPDNFFQGQNLTFNGSYNSSISDPCGIWVPGSQSNLYDPNGCRLDDKSTGDISYNIMSYRRNTCFPNNQFFSPLQQARMYSASSKPFGCGRGYLSLYDHCETGDIVVDYDVKSPMIIRTSGNISIKNGITLDAVDNIVFEAEGDIKIVPDQVSGNGSITIKSAPGKNFSIVPNSNGACSTNNRFVTAKKIEVNAPYMTSTEETGKEFPQQQHATAIPNPFTNSVMLRLPATLKITELAVYSMQGVLLRKIPVAANQPQVEWDGADAAGRKLKTGIYMINLQTGKKTIEVLKVLKQ
jgi:hypothetical protein